MELYQLQSMFPSTSIETLEEALRSNITIQFAIEELLSVPEHGNLSDQSKDHPTSPYRKVLTIYCLAFSFG